MTREQQLAEHLAAKLKRRPRNSHPLPSLLSPSEQNRITLSRARQVGVVVNEGEYGLTI